MGRKRKLEASRDEIIAMREQGYNRDQIARHFGVSASTVSLLLNPEARERHRERFKLWRAGKIPKAKSKAKPFSLPENPSIEDYMLPRQRVKVEGILPPKDTRSITGRLLGDPIYQRSALYKIRQKEGA